jgi:hypothetical protein
VLEHPQSCGLCALCAPTLVPASTQPVSAVSASASDGALLGHTAHGVHGKSSSSNGHGTPAAVDVCAVVPTLQAGGACAPAARPLISAFDLENTPQKVSMFSYMPLISILLLMECWTTVFAAFCC